MTDQTNIRSRPIWLNKHCSSEDGIRYTSTFDAPSLLLSTHGGNLVIEFQYLAENPEDSRTYLIAAVFNHAKLHALSIGLHGENETAHKTKSDYLYWLLRGSSILSIQSLENAEVSNIFHEYWDQVERLVEDDVLTMEALEERRKRWTGSDRPLEDVLLDLVGSERSQLELVLALDRIFLTSQDKLSELGKDKNCGGFEDQDGLIEIAHWPDIINVHLSRPVTFSIRA